MIEIHRQHIAMALGYNAQEKISPDEILKRMDWLLAAYDCTMFQIQGSRGEESLVAQTSPRCSA